MVNKDTSTVTAAGRCFWIDDFWRVCDEQATICENISGKKDVMEESMKVWMSMGKEETWSLSASRIKNKIFVDTKRMFSHNKMLSQKCSIIQSEFSTSKTRNLQTQITPPLQYSLLNQPSLIYIFFSTYHKLSYFRHPEANWKWNNPTLSNGYPVRIFLLKIVCC